jgi:uncharacterized protein YjbI with pentapeptide repeats
MTSFRKTSLSALTLCGTILAASVVSQPSYGGATLNGQGYQGVSLNGQGVQGVALNGVGPQGASLNGQGLQGTGFNGINAGLDGRVVGVELPPPSSEATR